MTLTSEQSVPCAGRSSVLALVMLTACAGTGSSAQAPPPSGPAPTAHLASPTPEASQSSGRPAVEPPASAPPAPEVSPAESSPFSAWAKFPAEVEMSQVGDHALIIGPPPPSFANAFTPILLDAKGKLTSPESLKRNIPSIAGFLSAAGKWPDAYMGYVTSNGRVGWSLVNKATDKGWQPISVNKPYWIDVGVQNWDKGRVLALTHDSWGFQKKAAYFRVVAGAPRGPLPKLAASTAVLPANRFPCTSAIVPESFTATTRGHVFVVGPLCGEKPGALTLEAFAPGATTSQLFTLELSKLAGPISAVALDNADVYVSLGVGPLMHFDGTKLERVSDVPEATNVAQGPDGTLWVAGGDKLYKLPSAGSWQSVPLPAGAAAKALFIPNGDQVFVLAGTTLYALHGRPDGAEEVRIDFGQQVTKLSLPRPATKDCLHPFVVLYAFTKVTPADYDFPLTRKAIRGQTWLDKTRFVVTEESGKKYFGAFPDSLDVGRRLVSLIRKRVKGSAPALLCAKPKVKREFSINLDTGEVEK